MSILLDHKGAPVKARAKSYRRSEQPVMGESFGQWAGHDLQVLKLPGGALLQFDLSSLTISDFRIMSYHYQVNSSLSALSFMLHQLQWTIECSNPRVAAFAEENMRDIWTRLVRSFSQAFWAGYSPNILQWENDTTGRRTVLAKVKDLYPEEASVNWKKIDGTLPPTAPKDAKPPKIKIYDGIKQNGYPYPVPVQNSLWYPLLMQNGDYGGKKILKSAFQPWYFSTLVHLFSNRYFERFGEPVPIGRSPSNETITINGVDIDANQYMMQQLTKLRSRSTVVLPSDKILNNDGDVTSQFEYDIEYLESQMRGADFERYLSRLDEEISLALFTPLLLLRTSTSGGSYNLGVTHMKMYLWQLNAIAEDWAEYINRYILSPMTDFNFGVNAPRPRIKFYKMGKTQDETNRAVLNSLVSRHGVKVDLIELGQATGLTLSETEELSELADDPSLPREDDREARVRDDKTRVSDGIIARIEPQIRNAYKRGEISASWMPDYGFASKLTPAKREMLEFASQDLASLSYVSADQMVERYSSFVRSVMEDA